MSKVEFLDLIKFFGVVEINRLFTEFLTFVKKDFAASKVISRFQNLNDINISVDEIYKNTTDDFNTFIRLVSVNVGSGEKEFIVFNQFKQKSHYLLQNAEASLKALLIQGVELNKGNGTECYLHKVFVVKECKNQKWDEIMLGELSSPFWSAKLRTLQSYFMWNSETYSPVSLLPVVVYLYDEKEVVIKIGVLRNEECCSKINWMQNEFSTRDKKFMDYVRIKSHNQTENFLFFKHAFEMMTMTGNSKSGNWKQQKEQKRVNEDEDTKYIGMTISNEDMSGFKHQINLKNYSPPKELPKWLHQAQNKTIYILFILSYENGPFLGVAEIIGFNSLCLHLSWCLESFNGVKLDIHPKVLEHLNNRFFVIGNGRELVEQYQKRFPDSSTEVKENFPKEPIVQMTSFKDNYQDIVETGGKLPIEYFIFITNSYKYYPELLIAIRQNFKVFDKNKKSIIFVTNAHLDCVLSLNLLTPVDGHVPQVHEQILLKMSQKIAVEFPAVADKRSLLPLDCGKELLKFYYECLNPRPANFVNIGNSCYLASMLQCLKVCFNEGELNYQNLMVKNTPLAHVLFETLYRMLSPQCSLVASDLIRELGKCIDKFSTSSQQDGFQFLMCLMNKVEKELDKFPGADDTRSKGISKDVFKKKFAFKIETTWKCKAGHVGRSFQLEYAVHVSPHASKCNKSVKYQEIDLKDCWKDMIDKEEMEQILCQECPEKEKTFYGELRRAITYLPEILIIYINRLDFSDFSKNEDNLRFELDGFEVNYLGKSGLYTAVAYCEHVGSLDAGHYRAIVRGTRHNVWFICDDLKDEHEAFIHEENYMRSRNVYTIFYRKIKELHVRFDL